MLLAGENNPIALTPYLRTEFEGAAQHYEVLGIDDRIELRLHEGGLEIRVDLGIGFPDRHLGGD